MMEIRSSEREWTRSLRDDAGSPAVPGGEEPRRATIVTSSPLRWNAVLDHSGCSKQAPSLTPNRKCIAYHLNIFYQLMRIRGHRNFLYPCSLT